MSPAAIRLAALGILPCTRQNPLSLRPLESAVGGDTFNGKDFSALKTCLAPEKAPTSKTFGGVGYSGDRGELRSDSAAAWLKGFHGSCREISNAGRTRGFASMSSQSVSNGTGQKTLFET